jgi:hypothetical protein
MPRCKQSRRLKLIAFHEPLPDFGSGNALYRPIEAGAPEAAAFGSIAATVGSAPVLLAIWPLEMVL